MQKVSSINVQNLKNKNVNLMEKFQGKPLLIIIYNNQCLGCTGRAIPLAYTFQKAYKNLQVIGIHTIFNNFPMTKEDIQSIFTINELPFPIFLDEGLKIYDQFEAEGTPQWILINKEGQLYRSIFGSQAGAQNRLSYAIEEICE